jgi:hypothetical protein
VPKIVVEPTAKALFAIPALDAELTECLLAEYPPLEPHETVRARDMRAGAGKITTAIFAIEASTAVLIAIFYRT